MQVWYFGRARQKFLLSVRLKFPSPSSFSFINLECLFFIWKIPHQANFCKNVFFVGSNINKNILSNRFRLFLAARFQIQRIALFFLFSIFFPIFFYSRYLFLAIILVWVFNSLSYIHFNKFLINSSFLYFPTPSNFYFHFIFLNLISPFL